MKQCESITRNKLKLTNRFPYDSSLDRNSLLDHFGLLDSLNGFNFFRFLNRNLHDFGFNFFNIISRYKSILSVGFTDTPPVLISFIQQKHNLKREIQNFNKGSQPEYLKQSNPLQYQIIYKIGLKNCN